VGTDKKKGVMKMEKLMCLEWEDGKNNKFVDDANPEEYGRAILCSEGEIGMRRRRRRIMCS